MTSKAAKPQTPPQAHRTGQGESRRLGILRGLSERASHREWGWQRSRQALTPAPQSLSMSTRALYPWKEKPKAAQSRETWAPGASRPKKRKIELRADWSFPSKKRHWLIKAENN